MQNFGSHAARHIIQFYFSMLHTHYTSTIQVIDLSLWFHCLDASHEMHSKSFEFAESSLRTSSSKIDQKIKCSEFSTKIHLSQLSIPPSEQFQIKSQTEFERMKRYYYVDLITRNEENATFSEKQ